MKNREYYAEKILDIACSGHAVAVNKETYELGKCCEIDCDRCLFHDEDCPCSINCENYFNAESFLKED